jgi:signal transduction histidine kinase/DNA-binding response OmpR family regulator
MVGLRRSDNRGISSAALYLLLLWLVFEATLNVYGQERGFRYLKNYTRKEYGGQSQNWCILQDKHGIIYVGNQLGLLEFDGVTWRKIEVPNDFVRSMAIDDTGTIYVGGINEIGFLAPDAKGALQYVSLLEHLHVNKRSFSDVWETHWTKQGIYFKTSKFLFCWHPNDKKIDLWESSNRFHLSFICNGRLFIRQENVGLMKMDSGTNSLIVVPGGETFAKKKIYLMLPYGNKKLLVGTRENGFYTYDGIEALPFPTEADHYLKENQLYHGIRLSSGDFALATVRGGLVIMDSQGRLKKIFNKSSGLQDDDVNYVFEDFQGNLWLAMDRGISKIEYVSPLSIYDERSNLAGSVWSVIKHNKDLYAGTTRGLFVFASPHGFRPAAGISSYCWYLLSIENSLLVATADGVFQVDDKNNIKHMLIENRSYFLLQSKKDPKRIWVGTREGLVSLYLTGENPNGKWKKEHQFENITTQIRTIVEDRKGNLWLGTMTGGILKADFPDQDKMSHPVVNRYHTSHGLPPGGIGVFWAAEHVMFATDKGIFRFDEINKRFIPDSTLGEVFADGSRGVFRIVEDKNKNIWLHSDSRNFLVIPQSDRDRRTFVIYKKPFLRIPRVQVNSIYPDPDGIVTWFASDDGLIRYDSHIKRNYDYNYPTLIRKVLANGKLIFVGSQSNYKLEKNAKSTTTFPIFDYRVRTISFEFAAPYFEAETRTRYQCFLEGYDDHWSALNWKTRKDYINLDSGWYTFRVRGQNVYGHLSSEAVYQFKILLPWYRTWWAFLSYVLVLFLLMYLIVKWQHSLKLVKEKKRLEQIVNERTKEINEKNQQLEEQSRKLKKMDRVKSRFFANISHEFRTPLTLIMGPLEQMLSDDIADIDKEMERKKKLTMMLRNSQRLLSLINQLQELSKFEGGKVKLRACRQNIIPFLKGTVVSFEPVANKYELDLRFQAEETNIALYFDPGKLEEVVFNLLSNAVKFTPAGGKIGVSVTKKPAKEGNFPSGSIEISVCDTGPGIPREQLEHIFNRFYQLDSTYELHRKGSGIGLALAKEMVELHHGEIQARSVEGEGTEFMIRLPMGDSYLKPEEIVLTSGKPYKYKSLEEIPALFMMEEEQDIPIDKRGGPADVIGGKTDSSETYSTEKKDVEPEAQGKNIILVVEDSVDFLAYIRGALESLYTVEEAKNGREGIQKAQKIIPDLIISDIMMPEVDGYALCRVLKNDIKTSHIPIILLTAKAGEENIVKGLETGADDYITKPFSTKILCVRIKNLIDLRLQLQLKRKRQMTMRPAEIAVSSVDENFYKELQDVIEKNLSDPEFNVEQLGKKLYMSRATLYRKIMALTGDSPLQFIRSYRLKRAAQLLKANFGNVTEVAVEVGFTNIAHFSQCFKDEFHQLPSTFQASEVE